MNIQEFEKGTAAYAHEKEVISRVFSRHGNKVSQDNFDRIFSDNKTIALENGDNVVKRRAQRYRASPGMYDAYILGDLSTQSMWSKYLDLLQKMILVGLAEQEIDGDKIVYSLKIK